MVVSVGMIGFGGTVCFREKPPDTPSQPRTFHPHACKCGIYVALDSPSVSACEASLTFALFHHDNLVLQRRLAGQHGGGVSVRPPTHWFRVGGVSVRPPSSLSVGHASRRDAALWLVRG